MPTSIPHSWVEIRDKAGRKLVTMIEILSPTNKRGQGRKDYLEKRAKILGNSAHLLEIDLLRKGQRLPMAEPLPEGAYFVVLTRTNKRPQSDVWPIALDEPLPTVRVPLLEPDPDVPLDLQQAFATIYDLSRYDLAIDYTKPPDVPLTAVAASGRENVNQSRAFSRNLMEHPHESLLVTALALRHLPALDHLRKYRNLRRPTRQAVADLIIHNAKVVTVDAKFSLAEAVAIRGEKIVAVGGNKTVLEHKGPKTLVIDAMGKTVLPGLYDSHVHPVGRGHQ